MTEELCITAKFVPKLLTCDQKEERIAICTDCELKQFAADDENFVKSDYWRRELDLWL